MPPALSRRPEIWAIVTSSLTAVLCTTALLLVPGPTRPWVLAVVIGAGSWASHLLWRAGRAVRDRLVPPSAGRPLPESLARLRAGLAAVTAELEPAARDADIEAGRYLELAHLWLDEAEVEAEVAAEAAAAAAVGSGAGAGAGAEREGEGGDPG
jgi:hypothetical protein